MKADSHRHDFGHQIAREWVYRRLDNNLSSEHRLHLDQHLEHCTECRSFEREVLLLDRRLRVELPLMGAVHQARGPLVPPLAAWLGKQWQQRLQAQARLRHMALVVLVVVGLVSLGAYFAQPENRLPAPPPPFFDQLNTTQAALAALASATPVQTESARATPLPRPTGRVLYEASDNRSTDLYFTYADASARAFLNPNPAVDRAPHPSPDRQWVAFLSNRLVDQQYEIYVTDAAGSRAERLTNLAPGSPRWTGEMAWSPDSRRLVAVLDHPESDVPFEVVRGDRVDESGHYRGQWEGRLYLIDRDSTRMVAITPPDLLVWNPAWSPDGQRIYFNALKNGYARLMSIRLDGSGLNAINEVDDSREQAGFSFSPDGKFLTYLALSRTRGTNHPDQLQLLDMDSNTKQVLKTMPNTDDIDLSLAARFATLQWSPDGQRLVYAIPKADGQANLKLLEIQRDPNLPGGLSTGAESVLFVGIDLYFPGHAPAWSLDGRSLAYLQGRRVYIISAHADGDSAGGSEIMEIYAGNRDEVGAGWLSWFD